MDVCLILSRNSLLLIFNGGFNIIIHKSASFTCIHILIYLLDKYINNSEWGALKCLGGHNRIQRAKAEWPFTTHLNTSKDDRAQ